MASLTAPILLPDILPEVSIRKNNVIVLRGTLTASSSKDMRYYVNELLFYSYKSYRM